MRILVLVTLAALAGCLAPDPAEPEEVEPAATATAPTAATPAADAPPAPATADEAPPSGAAERTTTLAWDGSTASAVCVMAAHQCQILQEPGSSWSEFSALGVPGRAIRASGTLTWEPATPATEQLHVFVFSLDETGMPVDSTRITGPSPLAFDVDLSGWTGVDFAYSLHGHHEIGGQLIVETSQPFHMETSILSLVDV